MDYVRRQLPETAPYRRLLGVVGVRAVTPVKVEFAYGRPYDRPMSVAREFEADGQVTI